MAELTPKPMQMPGQKQGRGCLFYFLVIIGVCVVASGGMIYYGYRVVMRSVEQIVNEYSDTTPAALPTVQLSDEQIADVQRRASIFVDHLEKDELADPLVLSGSDINALIVTSKELSEFRNNIFVSIDGDEISGEVSFPLEHLGYGGRYLNGKATLQVSLINDRLNVRIVNLLVKGQPVPDSIMAALEGQNLAESTTSSEKNTDIIKKIERIEIKDGVVTITPRKPTVTT